MDRKRAFEGLAGSPLAKVRRGRPRKWASDAERKRAERNAAKENVDAATVKEWNKRLAKKHLTVDRALFLTKATHGKGQIIYDGEQIESTATPEDDPYIIALTVLTGGESPNRYIHGRKKGSVDAEQVEQRPETEHQFHDNHPYPAGGHYPPAPAKAQSVKALHCKEHSERYRDDQGNEHAELKPVVSRKYWVVTLECGCVRDVTPNKKKQHSE